MCEILSIKMRNKMELFCLKRRPNGCWVFVTFCRVGPYEIIKKCSVKFLLHALCVYWGIKDNWEISQLRE